MKEEGGMIQEKEKEGGEANQRKQRETREVARLDHHSPP